MSYSRIKSEPISGSSIKWEDDDKKSTKKQKIRVHLKDTCFFCGRNMSSAKQTINHNIRIHGYLLPTRKQGYKRPDGKEYEYVREKNGKWDVEELACPSCWFHCPENDLEILYQHTRQEHKIIKVEGTKGLKSSGDEEEEPTSASVRARRSLTPNYEKFTPKYYPKPKGLQKQKQKVEFKKNDAKEEEDYEDKVDSLHHQGKEYKHKDEKHYTKDKLGGSHKEEEGYYDTEDQESDDEEETSSADSNAKKICHKLEELADLFRSLLQA